MSKIRQTPRRARAPREPHVRTVAVGFSPGYEWRSSGVAWGQLLSTSRGTLSVETEQGRWVVSSTQALWLPPHHTSAVSVSGKGILRRVYLRGAPCQRMPPDTLVVQQTPLLRALLTRIFVVGTLDQRRVRERRLVDVFVDELTDSPVDSVALPAPRDARAVRAAELVRRDVHASHDAERLAREAGASVRTLERLFRDETGLPFGAWRQRARMQQALVLLADGASVTQTALAVGYANTSAFVTAFKSVLGSTPGRYRSS